MQTAYTIFKYIFFSFLLDWDKVKVSSNNYSQMCNFKTKNLICLKPYLIP